MKLPAKLVGLAIGPDGRPIGLDLPSLDARGAADAWRAQLGPGPFYVRFEDRGAEPSLDRVQRLARLGEVWLDCAIDGIDGALDLLIAGASRLVLWGEDGDLLEAVGDSAVVGWDGAGPLQAAIDAAKPHEVPILALAQSPDTSDPGLYQAPSRPWRGAFDVLHVGPLGDDGDGKDDGDDGDDGDDE
ncbi:MAG: hypothetical protein AABY18_05095 [Candidatus Thermoplasmatota archaeon]